MADKVIFAEQTIEGFAHGSDTGTYAVGQPATFELVAGQNYKVLWDGSEYSCTAYAFNMGQFVGVGIGNEGAMTGASADIVEPFAIMYIQSTNYNTFAVMDGSTETSHDVGIYQVAEEDKEYLIWGSTLTGIADAIRAKSGETGEIAVSDMATKISEITGGGSSDVELVYVTFMSHDGLTELYKRAVVPGNDCMEIVAGGLIDAPTRESTAEYDYTFSGGWSTTPNGGADANALKNVTEDRTVYANYIATTRVYAVRFFDGDTQVGDTQYVAYGANATPPTIEKEGYQLDSWSPSYMKITADTDCYAQWNEKLTFANATWAQIAEISESGEAANYFAVGDTKTVAWGDDVFTVAIAGFNHDDLADGSGKAGISIVCKSVPDCKTQWPSNVNSNSDKTIYTYTGSRCLVRSTLNGTVWNGLPADLQSVIKSVNKKSDTNNSSSSTGNHSTTTTSEKLWLLSLDEIGHSESADYHAPGCSYVAKLGSKYDLFTTADLASSTTVLYLPTIGSTGEYTSSWIRNIQRTSTPMPYYWASNTGYSNYGGISATGLTSSNYTTQRRLCFGFCV